MVTFLEFSWSFQCLLLIDINYYCLNLKRVVLLLVLADSNNDCIRDVVAIY